jgi:hypothetical protein
MPWTVHDLPKPLTTVWYALGVLCARFIMVSIQACDSEDGVAAQSDKALTVNETELRRALWNEANTLIIDSLYSARGNQAAANSWSWWVGILGLPASLLSAVLAAGAAVSTLGAPRWLTAVLALAVAAINAARAFLRPEEVVTGHANKGAGYLALRNDARSFRDLDVRAPDLTIDQLRNRLHALQQRRNALNGQPPLRIPAKAYAKARASITAGESDYRNDPLWEDAPF